MLRLVPPPSAVRTSPVTWRTRLRDRVVAAGYRLLTRLGVPGAVGSMHVEDAATGHTVDVRVGVYYTILTIDNRDFYFHRLTGKLDGTGTSLG